MDMIKKGFFAATLAASAFVSTATPIMARDYYRHRDNTAGVAIGVGIIGLAIGAIAASSSNSDRRYRDERYRDGRYYDRDARIESDRYYRDDYYNRSRGYDTRGSYGDQRGGGWDDRYYSRRGY